MRKLSGSQLGQRKTKEEEENKGAFTKRRGSNAKNKKKNNTYDNDARILGTVFGQALPIYSAFFFGRRRKTP